MDDVFNAHPALLLSAVCMAAFLFLLLWNRRHTTRARMTLAVADEVERAAERATPKCVCGELATEPAPLLRRGRGAWDWLRNLFAAPPRYTREVDMLGAAAFCKSHAHVADSLIDKWIFDTRASYSKLNAEVAAGAANFEQEHLLRQIGESLTDKQKRATRGGLTSVAPIRPVAAQRDGTTGEES